MGDRGVDVERLAGDAHPLLAVDRVHGAHVVQPVGELDQDHAHVARHRQQHLAERLRLRLLAGREAQLVELGQAVDEIGGRRAEALDQLRLADAAILHCVVHQRRHDRLGIELPLGAQARDRDRMGDVRLAAGAELAEMGFVGEAVGLAHPADVARVEVVELAGQGGERGGCGVGGGRSLGDRRRPPFRGRLGVGRGGGRARDHAPNLARNRRTTDPWGRGWTAAGSRRQRMRRRGRKARPGPCAASRGRPRRRRSRAAR